MYILIGTIVREDSAVHQVRQLEMGDNNSPRIVQACEKFPLGTHNSSKYSACPLVILDERKCQLQLESELLFLMPYSRRNEVMEAQINFLHSRSHLYNYKNTIHSHSKSVIPALRFIYILSLFPFLMPLLCSPLNALA
jgi:hypothetical protein